METGGAARAGDHTRLQVVEDDGTGMGTEEVESIDDPAVELSLALREREFDVHQPAVAEHGHEHRDLAGRGADLHAATCSPIDLHHLTWLVINFLIDASASGADLSEVAADCAGAAGIAIGTASNLLTDAHR